MSTQTLPRGKGIPKKTALALFVIAALLAFSSIASAAQYDLVLNARSTGVIGFSTNGRQLAFDNAVNLMIGG